MEKRLKRIKAELYFVDAGGNRVEGAHVRLRGGCSGLSGDCTGISGICTGLPLFCVMAFCLLAYKPFKTRSK